METRVRDLIEVGELPASRVEALSEILEETGHYMSSEGMLWDFKREWPFSLRDDYFASIARLICAFSNSFGGIIVFGVHDEKRTGGHNKVTVNLDKFQQALNQLLSDQPKLSLRRYDQGTTDAVDVLLVRPISMSAIPIRFNRKVGKYDANVIWIRQNHEVRMAEPKNVPMLYCRIDPNKDEDDIDFAVSGLLPRVRPQ